MPPPPIPDFKEQQKLIEAADYSSFHNGGRARRRQQQPYYPPDFRPWSPPPGINRVSRSSLRVGKDPLDTILFLVRALDPSRSETSILDQLLSLWPLQGRFEDINDIVREIVGDNKNNTVKEEEVRLVDAPLPEKNMWNVEDGSDGEEKSKETLGKGEKMY